MTDDPLAPDHAAIADKEQKQVNRVYAAMVAMLVSSMLPVMALQALAFFLLLYVMSAAYSLRRKSDDGSLTHNHMEYLIRTFWISSLFFLIGLAGSCFYLAGAMQAGSFQYIAMALAQGQYEMTPEMKTFLTATALGMGPSMIYFVYRVVKGLARALRGYRIGNLKSWF